ncbi:MAG: hypothetical protein QOE64_690, partial [Frankiales bacterium]|nr:hypothetical protein [Frankiales bacterium]
SFVSPGDDAMCGTPLGYNASVDGTRVPLGSGGQAAGTTVVRTVTLPVGARSLSVWARDEAGNTGPSVTATLTGAPLRALV